MCHRARVGKEREIRHVGDTVQPSDRLLPIADTNALRIDRGRERVGGQSEPEAIVWTFDHHLGDEVNSEGIDTDQCHHDTDRHFTAGYAEEGDEGNRRKHPKLDEMARKRDAEYYDKRRIATPIMR